MIHAVDIPAPAVAAAACLAQPATKAIVIAGSDQLAIDTKLSFAQLTQMSEQAHSVSLHPPYGFYLGAVAYKITTVIRNDVHDVCKGPVEISVSMRLTNRHVEIARELRSDPCRLANVVAHYRHHADADEQVFQRYVVRITATLGRLPSVTFADAYRSDDPLSAIVHVTNAILEPVLHSMDGERAAVRSVVDTPGEVEKLESACTDHT